MKALLTAMAIMMIAIGVSAVSNNQAPVKIDKSLLNRFQKSCEKAVVSTRRGNEKIQLCECIVRNHAQHSTNQDITYLEKKYRDPKSMNVKLLDNEQIVLNDFDIAVAEECQKKPNFGFQSPARKARTK